MYGIRFRTHAGSGWVVDGADRPILYPSRKRAKYAMRALIERALPGEWYEIGVPS